MQNSLQTELNKIPCVGIKALTFALELVGKNDGILMEFGVASGSTLTQISQRHPNRLVYGFDSFRGLPERWRNGFDVGVFSSSGRVSFTPPTRSVLVTGLFSETLPLVVATWKPSQRLALIHIDCDIYSATKEVLETLAPWITDDTVFVFDELVNYPDYTKHEWRALHEFAKFHMFTPCYLGIKSPAIAVPTREEHPHDQSVALRLVKNVNSEENAKNLKTTDVALKSETKSEIKAHDVLPKPKSLEELNPPVSSEMGLYMVTHFTDPKLKTPNGFKTIYTGEAAHTAPEGALTDRYDGDTKNLSNNRLSELSAYQRIWKNGPRTRVVGFAHYRRFLQFSGLHRAQLGRKDFDELPSDVLFDMKALSSVDDDHSYLPNELVFGNSSYAQYCDCREPSEYDLMYEITCKKYPKLRKELDVQKHRKSGHMWNMFVMNWKNFDQFCGVAFDVLDEFCERKPPQPRDAGYVIERLFDAWIRTKMSEGHRVTTLPAIYIS